MKGLFLCILFIQLSFSVFSKEDEQEYIIDSVYVSINNKIVVNDHYNYKFVEPSVIFESKDTLIELTKGQRLKCYINEVALSPDSQIIKHRKDFVHSEYQWPGKIITKVKILKVKPGFALFRMEYIYAMAFILMVLIVFSKIKTEKSEDVKFVEEEYVRSDGGKIVEHLKELGYFKYVATEIYMEELAEDLASSINSSNILVTVGIDDGEVPSDYKLYECDGEDLYEEGGLIEKLEILKTAFQVRGLKLEWEDEKVDFTKNNFLHSIKLNGKEYIAYNDKYKDSSWGIAALNFIEMLNDQLELQKSDERVYPINGGNDGQIIFLTREQFQYIDSLRLHNEFRPMEIDKWKEVMS